MKKLLIIIISLLIYSCSNTNLYRVTITQGTVFAQEDLDKLEIGMTKDQVSFVMGQPSFENFFEKNVWNYIYKITTGDEVDIEKKVKLIFDEKILFVIGATTASFLYFFLLGYASSYFASFINNQRGWRLINIIVISSMVFLSILISHKILTIIRLIT